MKLVHVSDIHVWCWPWRPWDLAGKRAAALASLALGRAKRFPRARLAQMVERVLTLEPDCVLISGDFTTSSLPDEFAQAKAALNPIFERGRETLVVPGNHDRYTWGSTRRRLYERSFGEFAPATECPWIKWLDAKTYVLGLDPSRPYFTASGRFPESQLEAAQHMVADADVGGRRLVVLCHYPLRAPASHARELFRKRVVNAERAVDWLRTVGRHIYCCGHVHVPWTFIPSDLPNELCINAGAPLVVRRRHPEPQGFQEIDLEGVNVAVTHHGWDGATWLTVRRQWPGFFEPARNDRRPV
jgi:3',5'-cyclic AMP phosphodiesterase CpdA